MIDVINTSHYREMPFFDGIAGFRLVPKDDVRGWAWAGRGRPEVGSGTTGKKERVQRNQRVDARQGEDQMMHELKSCPGTLSDQGLKGSSSAAWSIDVAQGMGVYRFEINDNVA